MLVKAALFLKLHPALWPAVLSAVFAPLHLLRSNAQKQSAHFTRREGTTLVLGGAICLGLFIFSLASYLFANTFLDLWESLTGSIASVFLHGGAVYPPLATEERYASPYGPFLYLVLATSQWIFGANIFATKLPCVAAALLSVVIFWAAVRRQSRSATIAIVFAGLNAALLLAFRIQAFWPKPDGLILFAVTAGLVCALRNRIAWQILFGFLLGAAVDLKPHAAIYFLPLVVLADFRGWRTRAFVIAAATALLTAVLPFVTSAQFSFVNYLRFLRLTVSEGFSVADALDFLKWIGLLAALVFVGRQWQRHAPENVDPRERAFHFYYRFAIAIGLLLAAVPGSAVGAGPRHAMPFVPLVLYDLSQRFSFGAVRTCGPDRPVWRLVAYSALASCFLIATQTTARLFNSRAETRHPGAAGQAEIQHVLHAYPNATILMGVGSDENVSAALLRHEVVFAGQPIGIDVASVMDYRKAGVPEPNLAKLAAELRARHGRPLVWIVPLGELFSLRSVYDGKPIFSDQFRDDFAHEFALREHTAIFDIYTERKIEQAADEAKLGHATTGNHRISAANASPR